MSGQIALIDQFVNYLRFERHFSPYTARCYGADLRQYTLYMAGETLLRQDSKILLGFISRGRISAQRSRVPSHLIL